MEGQEKRLKIGEMLESTGKVGHDDVQRALSAQALGGGTIGEHLVKLGVIDDVTLLRALSRQTGFRYASLGRVEVTLDAQKLVRLETAKRHRIVPLAVDGRMLWLGMVNPTDVGAQQAVENEAGMAARAVLVSGGHLDELIAMAEVHGWAKQSLKLPPRTAKATETAPVEQSVRALFASMIAERGHDLLLTADAVPAIRVDNELVRLKTEAMSGEQISQLVFDMLTPAQRQTFTDTRELDFTWEITGLGRFRCNLYRQRGQVSFAARRIVDHIPTLEQLGLPPFLAECAMRKQGLVLVTGPTGHGKSTTLAALVDHINRHRYANVITIEDPIEYVHAHRMSNVNQREVGTDTASFSEGLRQAFRQAPDVLVIGEMRDFDSASIALTAAETGHLVIATMHSLNATAAVDRIIDLYPATQQNQVRAQLADSLQLVFSQRLVRRAQGGGRVLAWEKVTSALMVKNAVREGRAHSLRAMMQANVPDVSSIDQSLAELAAAGTITREEALKWADVPTYFENLYNVRKAGGTATRTAPLGKV